MFSNRNRFVLGSVVILFALAVTLSGLTGVGTTSLDLPAAYGVAPCYTPVVPMDDLMDAVDDNFEEISDQLKAKKYSKAMKAAYYVAEYANVLQFHTSEEVKGAANLKKWKDISVAIRDDMQKVALTIKKKDVAGAKKLLDKVEAACEACHDMRD